MTRCRAGVGLVSLSWKDAGADSTCVCNARLQELVFALLPVAREEIEQLKCAVGAAAGAAPEATAASAAGTAGSQAGSAASKLDAASGGAAAGTGLHPNALEPWDVEYAQAEWVRQRPSPLPGAHWGRHDLTSRSRPAIVHHRGCAMPWSTCTDMKHE